MAKKMAVVVLALCLFAFPALAEYEVAPLEGKEYYPNEKDWTYEYMYRVPQLVCGEEDGAALMVNDTLQTALDEMRKLALPMLANAPEMTENGKTTVEQDYRITCNSDHFFSFLTLKKEKNDAGEYFSLEGQTFDVGGDFPGETLTLRGVVMVGESSDQLAEAVLPKLYEEFAALQEQGICKKTVTREEFEKNCAPTLDFYADQEGNAVFFFQPYLMEEPSLEVPSFTFTPGELEELAKSVPWFEED